MKRMHHCKKFGFAAEFFVYLNSEKVLLFATFSY